MMDPLIVALYKMFKILILLIKWWISRLGLESAWSCLGSSEQWMWQCFVRLSGCWGAENLCFSAHSPLHSRGFVCSKDHFNYCIDFTVQSYWQAAWNIMERISLVLKLVYGSYGMRLHPIPVRCQGNWARTLGRSAQDPTSKRQLSSRGSWWFYLCHSNHRQQRSWNSSVYSSGIKNF